jgi:hypothetical protein
MLKCHVFHFSFLSFLFFLLQNQRAEQVLPSGEGWHQLEGGGVGERGYKGEYGAKKCVHMYVNAKMIFQESGAGRGDEGEWQRGKFMYDIFDTLQEPM